MKASLNSFESRCAGLHPLQDPEDVILDFAESRVLDHSALEACSASGSFRWY